MTSDLDTMGPEERNSTLMGIGKFLFVVVLVVLFFCLPTTWCVTASLEEAGATIVAPFRLEKT
jgi:hypothetical protein